MTMFFSLWCLMSSFWRRRGWRSTWLTRGLTPVASVMASTIAGEKFETPIALVLPVSRSLIIAFQVSTSEVAVSILTWSPSFGNRFWLGSPSAGNETGQLQGGTMCQLQSSHLTERGRWNALDEPEVEVVEAELLQGVVERRLNEVRAVLRVPELGLCACAGRVSPIIIQRRVTARRQKIARRRTVMKMSLRETPESRMAGAISFWLQ